MNHPCPFYPAQWLPKAMPATGLLPRRGGLVPSSCADKPMMSPSHQQPPSFYLRFHATSNALADERDSRGGGAGGCLIDSKQPLTPDRRISLRIANVVGRALWRAAHGRASLLASRQRPILCGSGRRRHLMRWRILGASRPRLHGSAGASPSQWRLILSATRRNRSSPRMTRTASTLPPIVAK